MILVKTRSELQEQLILTGQNQQVGLVPTMGALHEGHLSLVRQAVTENEVVVVSIFINPTQFNDPEDLKRYPRTLEADMELLKSTGCGIIFAPSPEEVYPEPDTRIFDFGKLERVMEGKFRPGHFNGVAQVVSKLFDMVKPQKAYFGLKDFQQLAIVRDMVKQLKLPVEIVACEIVREKNGLAMSSRNELLSPNEREEAALIYQTLKYAVTLKEKKTVQEMEEWVISTINNSSILNVEYFEIVDSETLQHVSEWTEKGEMRGCIAVFCGNVRLIDNIRY